jgi:hypothetical protein
VTEASNGQAEGLSHGEVNLTGAATAEASCAYWSPSTPEVRIGDAEALSYRLVRGTFAGSTCPGLQVADAHGDAIVLNAFSARNVEGNAVECAFVWDETYTAAGAPPAGRVCGDAEMSARAVSFEAVHSAVLGRGRGRVSVELMAAANGGPIINSKGGCNSCNCPTCPQTPTTGVGP